MNGGGGYEAKDKWRRLEVSPEAMDCLQLVREGTYGRVYSGTLLVKGCNNNKVTEHTINNNNYNNDNDECVETRDVLIKTVLGKKLLISGKSYSSSTTLLSGNPYYDPPDIVALITVLGFSCFFHPLSGDAPVFRLQTVPH